MKRSHYSGAGSSQGSSSTHIDSKRARQAKQFRSDRRSFDEADSQLLAALETQCDIASCEPRSRSDIPSGVIRPQTLGRPRTGLEIEKLRVTNQKSVPLRSSTLSCPRRCSGTMAVSDECVPNFVNGLFERELYKVYQEHRGALRDHCMKLDELFVYMEEIVGPIEALEKALSRVDWVVFTPWNNIIRFVIDENPENVVYVSKDDSEEILSLIEYLEDGWEEGCELSHLLNKWAGNVHFHGEKRNQRFRSWISTYPALFACEPYKNGMWAIKWIGMQCRVEIVTKRGTPTDTSPKCQ